MKINLENIHSPCVQCYIHGGGYSPENDHCQRCELNIAIQLLKSILTIGGTCSYCKRYNEACAATEEECRWTIDWKKAFKVYTHDS